MPEMHEMNFLYYHQFISSTPATTPPLCSKPPQVPSPFRRQGSHSPGLSSIPEAAEKLESENVHRKNPRYNRYKRSLQNTLDLTTNSPSSRASDAPQRYPHISDSYAFHPYATGSIGGLVKSHAGSRTNLPFVPSLEPRKLSASSNAVCQARCLSQRLESVRRERFSKKNLRVQSSGAAISKHDNSHRIRSDAQVGGVGRSTHGSPSVSPKSHNSASSAFSTPLTSRSALSSLSLSHSSSQNSLHVQSIPKRLPKSSLLSKPSLSPKSLKSRNNSIKRIQKQISKISSRKLSHSSPNLASFDTTVDDGGVFGCSDLPSDTMDLEHSSSDSSENSGRGENYMPGSSISHSRTPEVCKNRQTARPRSLPFSKLQKFRFMQSKSKSLAISESKSQKGPFIRSAFGKRHGYDNHRSHKTGDLRPLTPLEMAGRSSVQSQRPSISGFSKKGLNGVGKHADQCKCNVCMLRYQATACMMSLEM